MVPGLHSSMIPVVKAVINGQFDPLDPNFRVRNTRLHHRVALASGNTVTEFTFFNADPANEFVGNVRAAGLPTNNVAVLHSMGIQVETGLDINQAAQTAGVQFDITPGTDTDVFELAEKLRQFYLNGIINAWIADWNFIKDVHGAYNFPMGPAPSFLPNVATNITAGAAVVTAGCPVFNDAPRREFPVPVVLPPQVPLKVTLRHKAAISLAAANCDSVIKVDFDATIITPANG